MGINCKRRLMKIDVIEIEDLSTNVMAKMGKNRAIHLINPEKILKIENISGKKKRWIMC